MAQAKPGDVWDGIPAESWNRFEDVAKIILDNDEGRGANRRPPTRRKRKYVLVRNDSGSQADRYTALGIDGMTVEPNSADNLQEWQVNQVFKGVTPSSSHYGKFVICQEIIPDGEVGYAVASGLTVVKASTPAAIHPWPFADIKPATKVLQEAWYGALEILYDRTFGGDRWLYCRLGNFQDPIYAAKTKVQILPTASGLADILHGGSVRDEVTIHNDWATHGTIDTDRETFVRFNRSRDRWQVLRAGQYKPTIRFELGSALTTADASKAATIKQQWGPGLANPNSSVTVFNHLVGVDYQFEGAAGASGIASWDKANDYVIIQLECPPPP